MAKVGATHSRTAGSVADRARTQAETALLKAKTAIAETELWVHAQRKREHEGSADVARKYTFVGDVDARSCTAAILTLEQWQREDPDAPIEIEFNTPGGTISDGLALYDRIRTIAETTPVRTHATGASLSMGTILLQAGSQRTISPNAYLMIHVPQGGAVGSQFHIEDEVKVMKSMKNRLLSILVDRSDLTRQSISRNWNRKDWWFDAEEAVTAGLADEVR